MTSQEIKDRAPDKLTVVSYKDAKEQGLSYYFSGKPCMYNQVAIRDIKTRCCQCFICVAKNAFKGRDWAKNNKEKESKRKNEWARKKRVEPRNPTFIKPL